MARLVSIGVGGGQTNPFAESIAELAGLDVRAIWRPTSSFLNRLRAAELDRIFADIRGDDLPTSFTRLRKRDKVARLAAIFAAEKGAMPLSAEQKARAAAWLPVGMGTVEKTAEPIAAV